MKNDYDKEHPNLRGTRLWKQGDLLGAEKAFLASIKRNPESDTGYGILTGFYLEQGELRKARSTLKKWKEKTPLRFRASYHMMWTQIFSLEHNKQSALFHLKAALSAGFDNNDIILKEPKLEYIRDTPEFWELIRHNVNV
jgi:tetratricopeptide (TPR) repeat protein